MGDQMATSSISKYADFLSEVKAEKKLLLEKVEEKSDSVNVLKVLVGDLEDAQEVMNLTGALAQEEFEGFIEGMVTEALQVVFGSGYTFEMETKIVRNQPETYLYVVEDGVKTPIKDDMVGGGLLDLISMVLRVVVWSIQTPRTRPVMILDEPGKNMDRNKIDQFVAMIRRFHELLGLQFIIVTHDNKIIEMADRSFLVTRSDGTADVSIVQ
jgi:DNA repair exonuclease SbcCD ATPase subunit